MDGSIQVCLEGAGSNDRFSEVLDWGLCLACLRKFCLLGRSRDLVVAGIIASGVSARNEDRQVKQRACRPERPGAFLSERADCSC